MTTLKVAVCALLTPIYLAWMVLVCVVMLLPMFGAITYCIVTGDDGPADWAYDTFGQLLTLGR